jgi:hypothetical protein
MLQRNSLFCIILGEYFLISEDFITAIFTTFKNISPLLVFSSLLFYWLQTIPEVPYQWAN